MTKSRNGPKRKNKTRKPKVSINNTLPKISVLKRIWKFAKSFLNSGWTTVKIVYTVITVLTVLSGAYWDVLKKLFQPSLQTYREEKYITGLLVPDSLIKANSHILLLLGTNKLWFKIPDVLNGVKPQLSNDLITNSGQPIFNNLLIKIINKRVVVSAVLRDLNNEVIGKIEENKWVYVKDKSLDCYADEKNIEIIDNYNNVVFRLKFNGGNVLTFNGYIVDNDTVITISNSLNILNKTQPYYQQVLANKLSALKPLFPHPTILTSN
jgi:hypothetical protein